ncbi:MAG: acyl carrier protein [Labilithrix sp.]|nr:acyl carrier protein [Labilithrix sp.]MCW5811273.1 acyl carrier protein [Labilithrix sp.]
MNREERLRSALESVFGSEGLSLKDDDGPGTTPLWDSVAHLNLIMAIEAEFGVAFPTAEIPELKSLKKIRASLEKLDGS